MAKFAAAGVDEEYSPNSPYTGAVQVHDASVNWLKDVSAAVTGAVWNSIVPLELRAALGFCSFISLRWSFIGVLLVIFFCLPLGGRR